MYLMLSRNVERIALLLAVAGGLLLLGIIVLTCVSIAGRALFTAGVCCGPIRGHL
ncbi:MAG: hypothetical protein U5K75_02770 [Ahrensia sp.]|nr:hypothetical protein [Ahrensia sp.]